jgi:hypothetical protein
MITGSLFGLSDDPKGSRTSQVVSERRVGEGGGGRGWEKNSPHCVTAVLFISV